MSYYGDNHPRYAGNVVKAMASAKDGYPEVVKLFADQLAKLMNVLASLPDRTLLVKCKGMGSPFLLEVHAVSPARADEARVASFLGQVRSAHACYFDPRAVSRVTPCSPPLPAEVAEEDNPIA